MSDIIIEPEKTESPATPEPEQEQEQDVRLSMQIVNNLASAVAQLVDIESRAVVQPNDDKLKRELRQFISNIFLKHKEEFIGCWYTVRNEYEPLCNTVTNVLNHVDGIRQQQYQQRRKFEKRLSDAAAKLKAEQETPKQA